MHIDIVRLRKRWRRGRVPARRGARRAAGRRRHHRRRRRVAVVDRPGGRRRVSRGAGGVGTVGSARQVGRLRHRACRRTRRCTRASARGGCPTTADAGCRSRRGPSGLVSGRATAAATSCARCARGTRCAPLTVHCGGGGDTARTTLLERPRVEGRRRRRQRRQRRQRWRGRRRGMRPLRPTHRWRRGSGGLDNTAWAAASAVAKPSYAVWRDRALADLRARARAGEPAELQLCSGGAQGVVWRVRSHELGGGDGRLVCVLLERVAQRPQQQAAEGHALRHAVLIVRHERHVAQCEPRLPPLRDLQGPRVDRRGRTRQQRLRGWRRSRGHCDRQQDAQQLRIASEADHVRQAIRRRAQPRAFCRA